MFQALPTPETIHEAIDGFRFIVPEVLPSIEYP
jgi:hypothetical protein